MLDFVKSCANAKTVKQYVGNECYRCVGKFVKSQNCAMDSHFRTVILVQTEHETVLVSMISTLLCMDKTMLLRISF